jgi:hypothetical protein
MPQVIGNAKVISGVQTVIDSESPPRLLSQFLGFRSATVGPNVVLNCWEYNEDGIYINDIAETILPAGVPGPGLVRQRILHDNHGSGLGTPMLMYNTSPNSAGVTGSKDVIVWDLPNNNLIKITPTLPVGATNWGVGPPFVPPGETNGYLYFMTARAKFPLSGGYSTTTEMYRAKMDGSAPPEIISGGYPPVTGIGYEQLLVLPDYQYAYMRNPTSFDFLRFPYTGGFADNIETSATFSGIPIAYYIKEDLGISYWCGIKDRKQGRFALDMTVTFKIRGIDAFVLNSPNSNTNFLTTTRTISVNRYKDTSGYFIWSSPGVTVMKLGQPAGDNTVEGHTGESPTVSFNAHPVHGMPQLIHLVEFSYPWL